MSMKIVLDSSFLIQVVERKKDLKEFILEEQVELITTKSILDELESISKESTKRGVKAAVAVILLKQLQIKVFETETEHDDSVLELAEKEKAGIATADDLLASRAKKLNIKVCRLKENGKIN
ncbi:Ribonuclease VapC9 [uncultured archaeon]|nr:Ribonuclease VapC9 [uncultured archaeon]